MSERQARSGTSTADGADGQALQKRKYVNTSMASNLPAKRRKVGRFDIDERRSSPTMTEKQEKPTKNGSQPSRQRRKEDLHSLLRDDFSRYDTDVHDWPNKWLESEYQETWPLLTHAYTNSQARPKRSPGPLPARYSPLKKKTKKSQHQSTTIVRHEDDEIEAYLIPGFEERQEEDGCMTTALAADAQDSGHDNASQEPVHQQQAASDVDRNASTSSEVRVTDKEPRQTQ